MTRSADAKEEFAAGNQPEVRLTVQRFARRHFGILGTLRLHRAAIGWDLLKAPANVFLAPVYLLSRLVAWCLGAVGLAGAGHWMRTRQIVFETHVAGRVGQDVTALIVQLGRNDQCRLPPMERVHQEVAEYATVRNAVAEITTSLVVLLTGVLAFHAVTPGVVSLAGPVAEHRAQLAAIAGFPLGDGLGRLWYGAFPVHHSTISLALTTIALVAMTSILTTFAGIVADPVQLSLGIHRRRLLKLINRIDRAGRTGTAEGGVAGEHLAARVGDFSDLVISIWRSLKG